MLVALQTRIRLIGGKRGKVFELIHYLILVNSDGANDVVADALDEDELDLGVFVSGVQFNDAVLDRI